jgi:hypothetical protein
MSPRWELDTKTDWLTDRQSQCDFDLKVQFLRQCSNIQVSRKPGEYKRSACEDVNCELKALFGVCDPDFVWWRLWEIDWKDWRVVIVNL